MTLNKRYQNLAEADFIRLEQTSLRGFEVALYYRQIAHANAGIGAVSVLPTMFMKQRFLTAMNAGKSTISVCWRNKALKSPQ